ncbi:MAG: hypothetical protein IKG21_02950 [Atopobiaceae bacterium]|nr:hypothetical protein [Atopobiaceae bacterium]
MVLVRNKSNLVERCVLSVLVLCLLISSNTIIGSEFYDGLGAKACLLASNVLCVGIVARGVFRKLVTFREIGIWLLFLGAFGVGYAAIWLHSADPGSAVRLAALTILYLMGVVWVVLNREGHVQLLLDAVVNVIYVLAALSLILWVLGPLWEFVPANINMTYSWAPGDGTGTKITGYYYFLFFTQSDVIMGRAIARNSGVFVESPLYGFVLLIALLTEVFLVRRRVRKRVVIVLLAAILSTFSITAYLIVAMICAYPLSSWLRDVLRKIRGDRVKMAVFVLVSVGLLGAFVVVVGKKITSPSWAIRMDDYVAGFRAWQKSPLLGNGLKSDQAILNQMAGFRINNTGMSNTIMQVLAFGGIVLFASYALGLVGFFLRKKPKLTYFGVVYAVMWAVTVVTYLPISMAVLGMGLGETILFVNRTSFAGGPAPRCVTRFRIGDIVAAVCATCGIALLAGAGMYVVGSSVLPASYVARTNVEVRSLKDNKLITDAYSLDHVVYILGSQSVHLTTTSQLGIKDSDQYLTEASILADGVEMHCTSFDEEGSMKFARQAVRVASKVSWMVKNKFTLRYGEIKCERIDRGETELAIFFALSIGVLGAGIALLLLVCSACRAGDG